MHTYNRLIITYEIYFKKKSDKAVKIVSLT